ncbi:MAG: OadG family protein [Desulfobacterales bacterium]
MYGFEAISYYNGWNMAIAGALIVFAGLVLLSTTIYIFPKILMLWEKRQIEFEKNHKNQMGDKLKEQQALSLPKQFPSDINEIANLYKPLIEELGETFYLADLYEISKKYDFPHPHITLAAFRDSEILIPHGEGVFTWNQPEDNEKE